MLSNPKKAEAIAAFTALKHDPAGRPIINLLDILIDEIRVSNDTAVAEVVVKNQGKIEAYLELRRYILK